MSGAIDTGKIRLLSGDVISRIAAGEVVERPAAVVRELIDNSLDAGSTKITIEVKDGGMSLIRVVDDGEGMSQKDASMAFRHHATSKVVSDQDLLSVTTMGFRGEALPSIASVSKVRLITARREEPVGTQLLLTGGEIERVEDVAAPAGTQVEVKDLFYNTPARKKFLKTITTEFSRISQAVQQASLPRPGVQFHLRHNGQDVLHVPAVSSLRDRVSQVYHRRFADQCLEFQADGPACKLQGYTINPMYARSGRTPQDLFVNCRPVKNATVSHAVYAAYEASLAKGRHPAFVLFLEVDPARLDVNVHPTKREVRFLDQDLIHHSVRQAIRSALGRPASEASTVRLQSPHRAGQPDSPQRRYDQGESQGQVSGTLLKEKGEVYSWPRPSSLEPSSGQRPTGLDSQPALIQEHPLPFETVTRPEVIPLGQIGKTFLVAQVGTELQVVDQHTAHERVLFERLQGKWEGSAIASQPLLIPDPIDVPLHEAQVLMEHLADLEKLGLVLEPFGASSFLLRAVPASLGHIDHEAFIQDLVEDLAQWNSLSSLEARIRPILATLACHGAVRAGRGMDLPEIKHLIEDWVKEGLPMTCPHGRRVALRLPAEELAKIFGRA